MGLNIVIPIRKSTANILSDITNYRPISIMANISIIFGKCFTAVKEPYFNLHVNQLRFVYQGGCLS